MGAIAARLAQQVILTSDNPRFEPPEQILADILGDTDSRAIPDRRTAIGRAVSEAGPRDVILIAGKGHEDYQEVAGVRLPFSDVVEARAALIARAGL
jgi:UDP-N-acetylmuramoyl-L-alanyl-D-glutamate--2,6-diaminopimelate ligase